ncbi:unnamed protein product [Rotaria magnacalcarata]|uniref:Uncharacterized protein n=1 Tax=Rotaria magnacalcarata TaxID=392030 RepID=A0A820KYR4_9BILA|nr:unnamed protein product [Rotaria magnacalcarata]CAF4344550.1 unnamed protein product [Rotaria magnacalcarata]
MAYSTGSYPQSVAVGDFNNDTLLDIVVANFVSCTVSVMLGYHNLAFQNQMTLITGNGSRPRSLAIGNLNNDGKIDIVVANSGTNTVGTFLGQGNYLFTNQTTVSTGSDLISIAVGDFSQDNILDLVVANRGDNNVGVFLGYGNGFFVNQKTFTTESESQPNAVAVGDFNNDMLLDIIVANYGINKVGLLLEHGNGLFVDIKMFSIGYGALPFSVSVGDFNNDRKLDFAVSNEGTDNLKIFLQTC